MAAMDFHTYDNTLYEKVYQTAYQAVSYTHQFTAIWMHTSWMVPCLPPMKTDVIIAALPEAMDV